MGKNLKDKITLELEELLPRLQRISTMIAAAEDEWNVHYNRQEPEDQYLRNMFYRAGDKLGDAAKLLEQTFAEVRDTGFLHKQANGRYELNGTEIFCSSAIEFLHVDDDLRSWVATRIEHSDEDYRLVGYRDIPLEGMHVRIKRVQSGGTNRD